MIYIRCGFINESSGSEFSFVVVFDKRKHFEYVVARCFAGKQQATISESLMGIDGRILLRIVCRQTCNRFVALEKEDGTVDEAGLVIVHESSVEEEGTVLRICYYLIPNGKQVRCVSYNFHFVLLASPS